ncbi:MAG: hypothetical protein WCA12_16860 [Burkholderiales bacterium]
MNHEKALGILRSLSDGIHPVTGEAMPAESPYQHPEVIRALLYAVSALASRPAEPSVALTPSTAAKAQPRPGAGNAGKPWSKEEDERLVACFEAGETVAALAQAHGRSKVAVEARLAKFGKVPMPTGLRSAPRALEPRAPYAART